MLLILNGYWIVPNQRSFLQYRHGYNLEWCATILPHSFQLQASSFISTPSFLLLDLKNSHRIPVNLATITNFVHFWFLSPILKSETWNYWEWTMKPLRMITRNKCLFPSNTTNKLKNLRVTGSHPQDSK